MTFAWPQLLWLLALPLALLAWDVFRRRRLTDTTSPKILRGEAGRHHLSLAPSTPRSTRRPRFWLLLGLALAVVALARPQWGRLEEQVFDQSREIIIAVDLSRSMLAADIRPSRLERAKLLIQSLLERLAGERVGLVVFSGTAFLQSPLSTDYEILREFLPLLGPDYLPEGGTNYRALLQTSIEAFASGSAADRFLIILSDGEATDEDWQPLLAELKRKNIRALTLGLGTTDGAMIPDGDGGFVKDERGAVVLSRLESATLRELATGTNGVYRDASGWLDLAGLLRETVEAGRKGEFQETKTVRLVERFQWALAPALLFLLLSFWREFPVRPTPRDLKLTVTASGNRIAESGKIGTLAALILLAAIAYPAAGFGAESAPELSTLGKIVSRLSNHPRPAARDWAELARETVFWGQRLQSGRQSVPAGPVRDALTAVELGAALEAGAADWPKLREELEALLQNSDEPPPPPENQPQSQDQQKQDQRNQDRQQQDQAQGRPEKENSSDPQSGSTGEQEQPDAKPDSPGQPPDQPRQSAFGDMQQDVPPPPPSGETQKVGGAPEPKPDEPAETDPALAVPLLKLDQLRNQDSPGRLFQLLHGEPKPAPAKGGRNW
jgi:Ca-activated chloride channel family protein